MGVRAMENKTKLYNRIAAITVFIVLPVLIYGLSGFTRRTLLKEVISVVTLLAYFVMLSQFYLSRANNTMLKAHKMSRVIKWHKVLGYVFVCILLLHPFLIVVPRYFEAGVTPTEAFAELLDNINRKGLLLGLTAWIIMLTLGITSLFRNHLPFSYKTWRLIHGLLSIAFILIAAFHIVDMGRHINELMAWFIAMLSITGIALLLRTYILNSTSQKTENHG